MNQMFFFFFLTNLEANVKIMQSTKYGVRERKPSTDISFYVNEAKNCSYLL